MSEPTDNEIIEAMQCYGGSFARALGTALHYADATNLAKVKQALPELWKTYAEIVKVKRQAVAS
jgi:hypothetical protein